MRKKRITSEKLLGLLAILISISTLAVFIYQTKLIREDQHKSVYPHLNIVHDKTGSSLYAFTLRNQGIGPAFIVDISIIDKEGKRFEKLDDYVDYRLKNTDTIAWLHSDLYIGQLIQEKENIALIELKDKTEKEENIHFSKTLRNILSANQFTFEIQYKSIYEEEWTMLNNSPLPRKK